MLPPDTLAEIIVRLRTERGMTRKALAEAVGVCASYIAKMEKGLGPSERILRRLAEVLEVPYEEIENLEPIPSYKWISGRVRENGGPDESPVDPAEGADAGASASGDKPEQLTVRGCPIPRGASELNVHNAFCIDCPEQIPIGCPGACDLVKGRFSDCPPSLRASCPCASQVTKSAWGKRLVAFQEWKAQRARTEEQYQRHDKRLRDRRIRDEQNWANVIQRMGRKDEFQQNEMDALEYRQRASRKGGRYAA